MKVSKLFQFFPGQTLFFMRRRRELALSKTEPGKNWSSFETFIFVTVRGSSYKINQDPGREKSGRHFLKPFSRWPTPKIAKIKNKHNFGIINPMKLILVPNSMFLSMIYSLVYLKCTQRSHDLESNMAATPKSPNQEQV